MQGHSSARAIFTALSMALVIFSLLSASLYYAAISPMNLQGPRLVIIPSGYSLQKMSDLLHESSVVNDPKSFRLIVRILGKSRFLQAGEYEIPAGVSLLGLIELFQSGKTYQRPITIPEGLTSQAIISVLETHFGQTLSNIIQPPEGVYLPETYNYTHGDTPEKILSRMKSAQDQFLEKAWKNRSEGLPLNSPREALILASIVEKETALPEEREHIAGVFINRLERGMRLQSDPTIAYGLAFGDLGRALTTKDIKSDTPYNTYRINGLPPTPICNPGKASILAVLNPLWTEDLYFVADGTGGHAFARTIEEHNANVRQWRKLKK